MTRVYWSHWKSASVVRKFAAAVSIFLSTDSKSSLSEGAGAAALDAAAGFGSAFTFAEADSGFEGVFAAVAINCPTPAAENAITKAKSAEIVFNLISSL